MADADKEFKIHILTTAEGTGLDETAADFDKVKEKLHGVYQETRDFRQLFAELDREAPGFGSSLLAAVSGPFGRIAALTTALVELGQEFDRLNQISRQSVTAQNEVLQAFAQPDFIKAIEDQRKAIADEAGEWQGFLDRLDEAKTKQDDLNTSLQKEVTLLKEIEQARANLDSAQKGLAIARIQAEEASGAITPEQAEAARAQVEIQAIAKKQADKETEQNDELNAKKVALFAAQNKQAELDKAAKAAQAKSDQEQRNLKNVMLEPDKQMELIEEARRGVEWYQENPNAIGAAEQSVHQEVALRQLQDQMDNYNKATTPEANDARKKDADAAAAAQKAALDNQALIAKLTSEISDLNATIKTTRPVERQTAGTEQESALLGAVASEFKSANEEIAGHGPKAMQNIQTILETVQIISALLKQLSGLGYDISRLKAQLDQIQRQVAAGAITIGR